MLHIQRRGRQRRGKRHPGRRRWQRIPDLRILAVRLDHDITLIARQRLHSKRHAVGALDETRGIQERQLANQVGRPRFRRHRIPAIAILVLRHRVEDVIHWTAVKPQHLGAEKRAVLRRRSRDEQAFLKPEEPQRERLLKQRGLRAGNGSVPAIGLAICVTSRPNVVRHAPKDSARRM